jgi:membrane protein implicated in regulation of membrane protease activity
MARTREGKVNGDRNLDGRHGRAPGQTNSDDPSADAELPEHSAPESGWRGLFQRLLNVSIISFAGLFFLVGMAVLVIALTAIHGVLEPVFLEIAVSLILFGITTLFITVAVAHSLETRLEASITDILKGEKAAVVRLTQATQRIVQETQEDLRPLGGNWRALGLTNVYLTRSDALADFDAHIRSELSFAEDRRSDPPRLNGTPRDDLDGLDPADEPVDKDTPRLWIAASSMKGLLESASKHFDGLGIMTWAASLARDGLLDLRIIMTHPSLARLRAGQEARGSNAIPEEILEAVNLLKSQKVPPRFLRMVRATPTVFAIATRDQMLLNPYPYSQEAFRSFTLTVRRSHTRRDIESIDRDIFEQYERRHFNRPWRTALPLGPDYGIPLNPPDDVPMLVDGEIDPVSEIGFGDGSHTALAAGPAVPGSTPTLTP